jgi:hypothetical protein
MGRKEALGLQAVIELVVVIAGVAVFVPLDVAKPPKAVSRAAGMRPLSSNSGAKSTQSVGHFALDALAQAA